jgi:hypothetical protein
LKGPPMPFTVLSAEFITENNTFKRGETGGVMS